MRRRTLYPGRVYFPKENSLKMSSPLERSRFSVFFHLVFEHPTISATYFVGGRGRGLTFIIYWKFMLLFFSREFNNSKIRLDLN